MVVTSHDVARLAGVSQPTVSRALRNSQQVSAETRERVLQAARALGYVPSETGRALASGRTRKIGLLLTDLDNEFYPHVIAPMHRELESLGYQLLLQTESTDSDTAAERLISNAVDGAILATTTSDSAIPIRLRDRRIPFVYFNRITHNTDADSARADPTLGIGELVEAAVELGHRRIGAIFGPRNTSTGAEREGAVREALEDHGIAIPPARVVRGPFDSATGRDGARRLLTLDAPPTLIICSNDVVALGALNTARELGVAVPDQVSITGFDDLPPAAWPLIQLTSVAFDLDAMARRAATLLTERLDLADDAPYRHEVFPSRLVRRATLGPC